MYKLDIPLEKKEAAAIKRRQTNEEERKERIFDARTRIIGVDRDGLETQVTERKQAEAVDAARNQAYNNDMIRNDKLAVLLQERQDKDTRQLQQQLNNFRFQYQTPDSRREWDLNNPEFLKIQSPIRESDTDTHLGISSAQIFEGEDLSGKQRLTAQQKQRADWAAAQREERNRAEQLVKYSDYLYEMKQNQLDAKAMELQAKETEARRAVDRATKDFNQRQAEERKQRETDEKDAELQDNLCEMKNNVFGDLLTENPDVARSAFGSHRVITDRWKGMNEQQINDIRKTQAEQVRLNANMRSEEKRINDQWDANRIQMAKTGTLLERAEKRERRAIQKSLVEENKRLAKEQASRLNHLDQDVYQNRPSNDYFSQFNTTSR